MTKRERESRSRLRAYIGHRGFLRGTLSVRERVCGKANCRCTRGEKHVSLFLTRSKDGTIEQLYIPRQKEELARRWVENYHLIQGLLEKISSVYWDRLKRKD